MLHKPGKAKLALQQFSTVAQGPSSDTPQPRWQTPPTKMKGRSEQTQGAGAGARVMGDGPGHSVGRHDRSHSKSSGDPDLPDLFPDLPDLFPELPDLEPLPPQGQLPDLPDLLPDLPDLPASS